MRSFTILSLALILIACGPGSRGDDTGDDTGDDSGDDSGDDGDDGPPPPPPPMARCQAMDIVFVVDNSGSMVEEQTNLGTNFPMFANILDQYEVAPGQPLDYRVAVTTTGRTITTTVSLGMGFPPITITEPGDNGAFRNNCGPSRRWLERGDGNLASTLACRANVGTDGPGAAEMALYGGMLSVGERIMDGTNAGFLREDALLAVVMLTDEDDCSRTDDNLTIGPTQDICSASYQPAGYITPQDAIEFYDALKGGRGRWATAVIAGPTACTSAFGDAVNAAKLQTFVEATNTGTSSQNGVFSSICEGTLAPALQQALDTFQAACNSFPPVE
jgi:hypothetical protein